MGGDAEPLPGGAISSTLAAIAGMSTYDIDIFIDIWVCFLPNPLDATGPDVA